MDIQFNDLFLYNNHEIYYIKHIYGAQITLSIKIFINMIQNKYIIMKT